MATPLPYLASNKNVSTLFEKIAAAKIPDKFTHNFLATTVGLKGSNDRQLIPLLRTMGFIDQSGTPTPHYNLLKGPDRAGAVAAGMKRAYAPLFDADQEAQKLPSDRLKGLISQVAGVDADATARIASTFSALSKVADFERGPVSALDPEKADQSETEHAELAREPLRNGGMRTEFHYNLQIHLPANGDEETYLNIFNAIRKTFQ